MNAYFGLTKMELMELGTPEAQAELDRRAAKKLAKKSIDLTEEQIIASIVDLLSRLDPERRDEVIVHLPEMMS